MAIPQTHFDLPETHEQCVSLILIEDKIRMINNSKKKNMFPGLESATTLFHLFIIVDKKNCVNGNNNTSILYKL